MLRNLTCAVALVALVPLLVYAQQTPRPGKNELVADVTQVWYEVSPEGSGFSVLMPTQPTPRQDPVSNPNGHKTVNHSFSSELNNEVFMVLYADFPQTIRDAATIKLILDAGRDEALSQSKAKLVSESDLTLDGFTGREFVMELPNNLISTVRVYWGTKRLFQVIVVHGPDEPATVQAMKNRRAKFINSFSLRKWHESQ